MSYCADPNCCPMCAGDRLASLESFQLVREFRDPERVRCEWPDHPPRRTGESRPLARITRQPVARRASPAVRHRSRQVRLYVGQGLGA